MTAFKCVERGQEFALRCHGATVGAAQDGAQPRFGRSRVLQEGTEETEGLPQKVAKIDSSAVEPTRALISVIEI